MVFTKRKSCCKQTSKRRECVYLPARKRGRRGRGYRSAAEANRERLNIDQVFIFVWALDVLLFSIKGTTFFLRKKRTYEHANPRKFKGKKKSFIFEVKIWAYFYFDILGSVWRPSQTQTYIF